MNYRYKYIQFIFTWYYIGQVYNKDPGGRADRLLASHSHRGLPTISRSPVRPNASGEGPSSPIVSGGHPRTVHCRCIWSWCCNSGVLGGSALLSREKGGHQLRPDHYTKNICVNNRRIAEYFVSWFGTHTEENAPEKYIYIYNPSL